MLRVDISFLPFILLDIHGAPGRLAMPGGSSVRALRRRALSASIRQTVTKAGTMERIGMRIDNGATRDVVTPKLAPPHQRQHRPRSQGGASLSNAAKIRDHIGEQHLRAKLAQAIPLTRSRWFLPRLLRLSAS